MWVTHGKLLQMTVGINSVEQAAECSMARRVETSWHTCELFPSFKIIIFLNKVYNNSTEVWMPRSPLRLSRVDTGAQQFPQPKKVQSALRERRWNNYIPSQLWLNSDTPIMNTHTGVTTAAGLCQFLQTHPQKLSPYKFKSEIFPVWNLHCHLKIVW